MDIKEFYPSITKDILDNAINFAKSITTINNKELCIIYSTDCEYLPNFVRVRVHVVTSTSTIIPGTVRVQEKKVRVRVKINTGTSTITGTSRTKGTSKITGTSKNAGTSKITGISKKCEYSTSNITDTSVNITVSTSIYVGTRNAQLLIICFYF